VKRAEGVGLGGLTSISFSEIESDQDGHTVTEATITFNRRLPDRWYSRKPRFEPDPTVAPIKSEIDFKAPDTVDRQLAIGDRGFVMAKSPAVPVHFPGFRELPQLLHPVEFMVADMIVLATAPREVGEGGMNGFWLRSKDLFTLDTLLQHDVIDARLLTYALDTHPDLKGRRLDPATFDIIGRRGEMINTPDGRLNGRDVWLNGSPQVTGANEIFDEQPLLAAHHPSASRMMDRTVEFMRGFGNALKYGDDAVWRNDAWHTAVGTRTVSVSVSVASPDDPPKQFNALQPVARGFRPVARRSAVPSGPPEHLENFAAASMRPGADNALHHPQRPAAAIGMDGARQLAL
jgi:hypothetical protein